jgi:hypothetical protein
MKCRVFCPSDVFFGEVEAEPPEWEEADGRGTGELNEVAARQIRTLLAQRQDSGPFALEFADGQRFRGCNFVSYPSGKFVYITIPDAPSPVVPVPVG